MKETRFKDTEVGLIPEDWEVVKVADLADNFTGLTYSPENVCNRGILVLRSSNIQDGRLSFKDNVYVDMNVPNRTLVKNNDVLVCVRNGSARLIGKCALITGVTKPTAFGAFMTILRAHENIDPYFVHYIWQSASLQKQVQDNLGATINQITNRDIDNFVVASPTSKGESIRIASALTSIDNLLSSLDKLIAKKKDIKKGTMQQLLTGKKRLKGFTELWVEKELWEMTIWDKKFNGVPSYMQQRSIKYPYVLANVFDEMETHGGDVFLLSTGNYVGWTTEEKAGCHLCEGEVVAIPWGGVANVKYAKGKFVTADNRIATSSDLNVLNNKYLYYAMLFRSEEINSFYRGASIKHPCMLDVLTMRFDIPCIAEQTAIASVLTAMDNEIAALEAKRAKYESIKQGMMQQLLTGKIRLVETAAKTNTITANVHFRRSVLAAEIADRLCEEPTFGHVKMEKMLFLTERLCHIDIGSHYHRDAAGPYDNNALRSIDSQLRKQKWFEVQQTEKGYKYVAMPNRGKHKTYFDKYYSNVLPMFDKIINTFKTQRTEQCEIVATLYSAWEDLIHKNQPFTDADIVNEVLNNWHESKKRISRERWHESIQWMRNNGFAPNNISR